MSSSLSDVDEPHQSEDEAATEGIMTVNSGQSCLYMQRRFPIKFVSMLTTPTCVDHTYFKIAIDNYITMAKKRKATVIQRQQSKKPATGMESEQLMVLLLLLE